MEEKFFKDGEEKLIENAIAEAEKRTSGEVRVRIEKTAGKNPGKTVIKAFKEAGMKKTKRRNGIMFFIAVEERMFIIYGDKGIDRVVPKGFWEDVRDVVIEGFKKEEYVKAMTDGIEMAGEKLAHFFHYEKRDRDELSNKISY